MSLPMKAEVFMHFGQSASPQLSATLDGLSRDIGRLCGCILLNPGMCSSRQEQAETPLYGNKSREIHTCKKTNSIHSGDWVCYTTLIVWCLWGLLLSLFLGSDNTLSVSFCTLSYSKNYRQSVCECICTSGLFVSVQL